MIKTVELFYLRQYIIASSILLGIYHQICFEVYMLETSYYALVTC